MSYRNLSRRYRHWALRWAWSGVAYWPARALGWLANRLDPEE